MNKYLKPKPCFAPPIGVKISQMAAKTGLSGQEYFPYQEDATNGRISTDSLKDYIQADLIEDIGNVREEIAEQIQKVEDDISSVDTTLNDKLDQCKEELEESIESTNNELTQKIESVEEELTTTITETEKEFVDAIGDLRKETSESDAALQSSIDKINTYTVNGYLISSNPVLVKDDVGLSEVTNDAQVKRSEMGVANGVATLEGTGKVPAEQLPSYVDDVLEGVYVSSTQFTLLEGQEGEVQSTGVIYVDVNSARTYRWTGSMYVLIGTNLELGETSSTAYPGDKGKEVTDRVSEVYGSSSVINALSDITFDTDNTYSNALIAEDALMTWNGYNVEYDMVIPYVTTSKAGVMSSTDKNNLEEALADIDSLQEDVEEINENFDNYATMELVVNLHATITFSSNRTVIYKGESDTVTLSHSATFNGDPLTYTLTVDGTSLANPYTLEDSHTFTGIFAIDNNNPNVKLNITRTVTVNAYYPRYYGFLTSSTITSSQVTTLTKQARASSAAVSSLSVNFTSAGYLWLCVPSGMTVSSVTSSGFAVPMEDPITVAVSGKGDYLCYRSTNQANAGTVTYVVS